MLFKKQNRNKTTKAKILGSLLVALSGIILFSDKIANIFSFELSNTHGFADSNTFLWVLSQTLSPILILLASLFTPYRTSYLVPVYIYTVQLIWTFNSNLRFDDYLLHLYAIGVCIGYTLLGYLLIKINSMEKRRDIQFKEFKKETKEVIELLKKEILTTSK